MGWIVAEKKGWVTLGSARKTSTLTGEELVVSIGVNLKRARCLEYNVQISVPSSRYKMCVHSLLGNVPIPPPIHQGCLLANPYPCYPRMLRPLAIRPNSCKEAR